jgi:ankyrin repeat protein
LFQDRAGDTNLIIASKAGHKTIVEALIKRYADVDTKVGYRDCGVTFG